MLKGVLTMFIGMFRFISNNWRALPKGFTAIMILVVLFVNVIGAIMTGNVTGAIEEIATTVFLADMTIQENTNLALEGSPDYGFYEFLIVINSYFILYFLIRIIGKILIHVTGSQATFMAYVIGAIMLGIIELVSIKLYNGSWFIPFWNGALYGIINIQALVMNIHLLPVEFIKKWFFSQSHKTMENISNVNISELNITQ